jgi:hypothetical protein
MPIFKPIFTGLTIRQDSCDLVDLNWQGPGRLSADFLTFSDQGEKSSMVRVTFDRCVLARIIEEFVYSLDGDEPATGIHTAGFAYAVEGCPLLDSHCLPDVIQAASLNELRQFDFISLNTCLQVISNKSPHFQLVEKFGG